MSELHRLCDLVRSAQRLVVFTGAGISGIRYSRLPLARWRVVNRDGTPQDHIADLRLRAEIGPTMRAVIDAL